MRWVLAFLLARYLVRKAKEAAMPHTTAEKVSELKVRAKMLMDQADWHKINLSEVEYLINQVHKLPGTRDRDALQDALIEFHSSLRRLPEVDVALEIANRQVAE